MNRAEAVERSSMLNWWPKVEMLKWSPETYVVSAPANVIEMLDGLKPEAKFVDEMIAAAMTWIGFPLFLRTDQYSGKHSWSKACYVPSLDKLWRRVWNVLDMATAMDLPTRAFVLRRYIEPDEGTLLVHKFLGMPLRRELRYFVSDGRVVCRHSYWPADAVDDPRFETRYPELRAEVERLDATMDRETAGLYEMVTIVARSVPGDWSVDFMWCGRERRWYLIDMADASVSWHPECEYAGRFEHGHD
jgi:hypothetical protein